MSVITLKIILNESQLLFILIIFFFTYIDKSHLIQMVEFYVNEKKNERNRRKLTLAKITHWNKYELILTIE